MVVRCRPLNARERALGCAAVVSVDPARGRCALRNPAAAGQPPKLFAFDGAYRQEHGTEQIYNDVAYPLVEVRGDPAGGAWAGGPSLEAPPAASRGTKEGLRTAVTRQQAVKLGRKPFFQQATENRIAVNCSRLSQAGVGVKDKLPEQAQEVVAGQELQHPSPFAAGTNTVLLGTF